MKFFNYIMAVTTAFLCTAAVVLATMSSDNYQIIGDVFSTGGLADSTSTNYALADTVGEAIIWSATSTSGTYGIKAGFQELYLDRFLTLSIADPAIELGTLDSATAKTDSHTMVVDTNASGGFTITASGSTLTSAANTITAIGAVAAASTPGTEQFGINLVANTSPSVGANVSGTAPIGSVSAPFNTANSFAFDDTGSNTIASSNTDVNETTYTVSYVGNISSGTESGTYTTTITYSATANF